MEDKITISSLSGALMNVTGKTKKVCDDFLKEFFKLVAESLKDGEPLKIKGFGTFKVIKIEARTGININTGEKQEISSYNKVVFTPAKELASAINAPFEEFITVELDENLPDDIFYDEEIRKREFEEANKEEVLAEEESNSDDATIPIEGIETYKADDLSNENEVNNTRLEEGSNEEGTDDLITLEAYSENTPPSETIEKFIVPAEDKAPTESSESSDPAEASESAEPLVPAPIEPYYNSPAPQKSRFGMGLLIGALSMFAVCAMIFIIGCFCDWWPENLGTSRQENVVKAPLDTLVIEENPVIVPQQVIDTVTTTRYLTTIARERYGNYNFWPYIYVANDSILGHPDRITPGTAVVVPDIKELGLDPDNKADEEKAKQLAAEIYQRYKRPRTTQ